MQSVAASSTWIAAEHLPAAAPLAAKRTKPTAPGSNSTTCSKTNKTNSTWQQQQQPHQQRLADAAGPTAPGSSSSRSNVSNSTARRGLSVSIFHGFLAACLGLQRLCLVHKLLALEHMLRAGSLPYRLYTRGRPQQLLEQHRLIPPRGLRVPAVPPQVSWVRFSELGLIEWASFS